MAYQINYLFKSFGSTAMIQAFKAVRVNLKSTDLSDVVLDFS